MKGRSLGTPSFLGTFLFAVACGVLLLAAYRMFQGRDPAVSVSDSCTEVIDPGDREWESVYDGAALAQIQEEIDSLNAYLFEETKDFYDQQFLAGNYEIVADADLPDGSFGVDLGEDLAAWRVLPSGEVRKVTLPVEGFESAYEARHRIGLLMLEQEERGSLPLETAAK